MIVGVPDGIGSYLVDRTTVRVIAQSESYGPLRLESYPFPVNDGLATFTGSHVQYVDYDRFRLSNFMSKDRPASDMVKGMGEVITKAYNLKGLVLVTLTDQLHMEPIFLTPMLMGKFLDIVCAMKGVILLNAIMNPNQPLSFLSFRRNYVVAAKPGQADWLMQSLCAAHLEIKHQWGEGIGLEDDTFITNEEWNSYTADVEIVGLSSHAIDLATGSDWAVGAMTNGGFEKIVEINPLHKDYVVLSPSGKSESYTEFSKNFVLCWDVLLIYISRIQW